jgi:argininosuccinate lyase
MIDVLVIARCSLFCGGEGYNDLEDFGRAKLTRSSTLVAYAEKNRKALNQLTLAEYQKIDAQFGEDTLAVFELKAAMERRSLVGAPGTREVRAQLARWRKLLK